MVYDGKLFDYSKFYRLLFYSGTLLGLVFLISSTYFLLTESFGRQTLLWILGICLGMGMVGGGIVELSNYHNILVDDRRISLLRPSRRVDISWNDIDKVFYTRSEGVPAKHPFISFYIKSKNGEIIKISQYIKNFHELGTVVLEKCPTGKAEYIPFLDLARLYYKSYFKRPITYHH